MDWIEQWFGFAPDGGDGTLELVIMLVAAAVIVVAGAGRTSSGAALLLAAPCKNHWPARRLIGRACAISSAPGRGPRATVDAAGEASGACSSFAQPSGRWPSPRLPSQDAKTYRSPVPRPGSARRSVTVPGA
jgi:hypothetical protein